MEISNGWFILESPILLMIYNGYRGTPKSSMFIGSILGYPHDYRNPMISSENWKPPRSRPAPSPPDCSRRRLGCTSNVCKGPDVFGAVVRRLGCLVSAGHGSNVTNKNGDFMGGSMMGMSWISWISGIDLSDLFREFYQPANSKHPRETVVHQGIIPHSAMVDAFQSGVSSSLSQPSRFWEGLPSERSGGGYSNILQDPYRSNLAKMGRDQFDHIGGFIDVWCDRESCMKRGLMQGRKVGLGWRSALHMFAPLQRQRKLDFNAGPCWEKQDTRTLQ